MNYSSLYYRMQTLQNWLRIKQLKLLGIKLGTNTLVEDGVECKRGYFEKNVGRIQLGASCQIKKGAVLNAWGGSIDCADNVYIGPYSVLYGHGGISIGADTLIAMHCSLVAANHSVPDPNRHIRWEPDQRKPIKIGSDVWLGAGVTVLAGVTVGDGCIVGAGAVITKDLPPYSIAMGVPANVVGKR